MLHMTSGRNGYINAIPVIQSSNNVNHGVYCDICLQEIVGVRYKCSVCPRYHLCSSCMDSRDNYDVSLSLLLSRSAAHPNDHYFLRISRSVGENTPPMLADRSAWVHKGVSCAECKANDITGYRYFCPICATSYCEACEFQGLPRAVRTSSHRLHHNLLKMSPAQQTAEQPYIQESKSTDQSINAPTERTRDGYVDIAQYGVGLDTLKAMLTREEHLRTCEETQQQLMELGEDSYVSVVDAIQAQVSQEFGLSAELGMMLLRCAESFARTDAEHADIVALSLYRRFNRCIDGNLQVGDITPILSHPVHLLDTCLTPVSMFEHLHALSPDQPQQPMILFAGSYS